MELDKRIEEVVDKAFEYHFELFNKCLRGEREPLNKSSRALAIQVETYELINECQEWKPWKKGKETDIEAVKEEIADVLLFTFDKFCLVSIFDVKESNILHIKKIMQRLENIGEKEINLFKETGSISAGDKRTLVAIVMKSYDITIEDVLRTMEQKIIKNKNRTDHV